MEIPQEAVLQRIFIGESDRWHHQPLDPLIRRRQALFLGAALVAQFGRRAKAGDEPGTRPTKMLPMAGEVFEVGGHAAFLIPSGRGIGKDTPWVWYAPTLPGLPGTEEKWMFQRFLDAGIAVAGIDVGESYGNPPGRALYSAFHTEMVSKRGLSRTPCLLARSRGGLMLYNWAAEHPTSLACVAGIYPVCNLASYPGVARACGAYGMTESQLTSALADHNPIDRIGTLAKAHVPIYHIHGDSDAVVPLELNSGELARRYRQAGGEMTLNVVKGRGHDMWSGWFECQELVDFIVAHARPVAESRSGAGSGK